MVMNHVRQVPEELRQGVALESYVPYDEEFRGYLTNSAPEPTVTLPSEPIRFEGVPQEAADCYTLFAETAKIDWYSATTKYCFCIVPDTKEHLLESNFRFLDYEMLDWIKLREELWAVQVRISTTQGNHGDESIFHYVGLVDGEYRVMLNSDQIPEYLQRYVDFGPYEPDNEGSLVDSYYPTHTDPNMHSVGPMEDDVIIAYGGMFNLWDKSMPAWYNYALKSIYTDRRYIDLYELFCNDPGEEMTQKDRDYLKRIGVETEGLRKYSTQMMDKVLKTYFDTCLADCAGVGLDRMIHNQKGSAITCIRGTRAWALCQLITERSWRMACL